MLLNHIPNIYSTGKQTETDIVFHVYILLQYMSHCTIFIFCVKPSVAGVADASLCVEGAGSNSSTSTTMLSKDECFDEHSNMRSEIDQQVQTTAQSEEQQVSTNITCERTKVKEKLSCEQQTGQLVKEVRSHRELGCVCV